MASSLTDISMLPDACIKLKSRRIFSNMLKSRQFSSDHLIQIVDAELDLISSLIRRLPAYFQIGMVETQVEDQVAFHSLVMLRFCQKSRYLSNGIKLTDGVCVPSDRAMADLGLEYMTRSVLRMLTDHLRRARLDRSEFNCLFYLVALDREPDVNSQEFEEIYFGILRLLQMYLEEQTNKRSLIKERISIILAVKKTLKMFSSCFFDDIMWLRKRQMSHKLRTFS